MAERAERASLAYKPPPTKTPRQRSASTRRVARYLRTSEAKCVALNDSSLLSPYLLANAKIGKNPIQQRLNITLPNQTSHRTMSPP